MRMSSHWSWKSSLQAVSWLVRVSVNHSGPEELSHLLQRLCFYDHLMQAEDVFESFDHFWRSVFVTKSSSSSFLSPSISIGHHIMNLIRKPAVSLSGDLNRWHSPVLSKQDSAESGGGLGSSGGSHPVWNQSLPEWRVGIICMGRQRFAGRLELGTGRRCKRVEVSVSARVAIIVWCHICEEIVEFSVNLFYIWESDTSSRETQPVTSQTCWLLLTSCFSDMWAWLYVF